MSNIFCNVPEKRRKRRGRKLVALLCIGTILWYGFALYHRLFDAWLVFHVVSGFVSYGYHETEFSPDGAQIAIAHSDDSKVLDCATGEVIARLVDYNSEKGISDFSSDGRIISRFSGQEKLIKKADIWRVSDGRRIDQIDLPGNIDTEGCLPVFSPDNEKIVALYEGGLVIWNSSDVHQRSFVPIRWNKEDRWGYFLSWRPQKHEAAVVDVEGKVLRVDLEEGKAEPLLTKQVKAVKSAKWSPDGTRLVTVDRDESIVTVWDIQTNVALATWGEKDVTFILFSPDGKSIATVATRQDVKHNPPAPRVWDRRTRVWDSGTGKLIQELPTTAIVTFSPDWSRWVEAGPDGIRIAQFDGSEACSFGFFDGHGSICRFSQDSSRLSYVNGSGLVITLESNKVFHAWYRCFTYREIWLVLAASSLLYWFIKLQKPQEVSSLSEPQNIDQDENAESLISS